MLNIVLHEPEIASNTGNIGRTLVATGCTLHLIDPIGFVLTDKALKRAGMDYWPKLNLHRHVDYEAFLSFYEQDPDHGHLYFATTKAHRLYTDVSYGENDYIMFGKESAGIPEEILVDHEDDCIRIPMGYDIRSLNLANSVSIVLYEALRQLGFPNLEANGMLHHLSWKDGWNEPASAK